MGLRAASAANLVIERAGPAETVFSHESDACQPLDIPDAPARAFRDAGGRVHLFASHYINLAAVGPDLNSVKRECIVVFQGAGSNDPATFDNQAWLTSFWTKDGKTIYALVHNEFHGEPLTCSPLKCWYNAVTSAVSRDRGFHFTRAESAIVAAPAYPLDNAVRHPVGYFGSSGIQESNGYYSTVVWAEAAAPQERGACLLRTADLTHPESWRAWDGSGFNVRLGNPYSEPSSLPPHVCSPVDSGRLRSAVLSLVRHRPTGRYIGLMSVEDGPRPGFFVSDSTDLLNWSEPSRIMDTGPAVAGECGNRPTLAYPALLDANSPSRNFEIIGNRAYLYFTQFHFKDCEETLDRDLLRVPIIVKPLR